MSGEKVKKNSSQFNVKYIEMIPVKFSTTLIFSSRNFNFFQFLMNCPQWWKIRKILSVRWESGKIFSSKFNVKYIEMIPVKFSTTLIFSSVNFNFFSFFDELSTEMKNLKKSKCQVRKWKKNSFQIQRQVYRNDPRQIL